MKQCSKCGETKPKSEFGKRRRTCKACIKLHKQAYYQANSEKIRAACQAHYQANSEKIKASVKAYSQSHSNKLRDGTYLRKYGITLADYDQMLEAQNGVCKVCGTDTPGGKGRFHVDHCHETGKIRGLLCHCCNLMLGNAKDNPTILANAIAYLTS